MITADPNNAEIRHLIQDAGSPSERATLMVLLAISNDLAANTIATRELATEMRNTKNSLDVHVKEEMALFHGARGAWKASGIVITFFFTILWGLTTWIVRTHVDQLHDVAVAVAAHDKAIARIEGQGPK